MSGTTDSAMGRRFANRVCLVTAGAGSGIGGAIVRALLREGAIVVATDRSGKRLGQLGQRLAEEYPNDRYLLREVDGVDEAGVVELCEEIRERYGRIDSLVNSVGINRLVPLEEMSLDTWREVLDVCVTSHFLHLRSAWSLLGADGGGTVVNIASISAIEPTAFGEAHYAAGKAAVIGLTRAAAREGVSKGIRVNAVAPGLIWHENLERSLPKELLEAYRTQSPLGRPGEPDEVADVVLFLLSKESRHITGEVLRVAS